MDRLLKCAALAVLVSLFSNTATAKPDKAYKRHDGELSVLLVDDADQQLEEVVYELTVPGEGKRYQLDMPGSPPFALRTGQKVRVLGKELRGKRLGVKEVELLELGSGKPSKTASGNTVANSTSGLRSSAVILINLLDSVAALTPQRVEQLMWAPTDSTQDLYLQDTRGAVDFVRDSDNDGLADVYGPVNVPMVGADVCDQRAWSDAARAQLAAQGHDLDGRDHYVYVLSGKGYNGCSFKGVAELGGDEVWINGTSLFVFVHELGHNLNLHHAGSDLDNDGAVENFYGDVTCFMGASYKNIFMNAPHKESIGILDTGDGSIVDVPANPGYYNYMLEPLALPRNLAVDPQAIRIPRDDLGRDYYVSLRDATGYDANLNAYYREGVSIHWYITGAPGTVTGFVTTLKDGESFIDDINGITITQNASAADGSWADVSVRIDEVYDSNAPGLELHNMYGQFPEITVGPDGLSSYAVTLLNNDGPGTPPTRWSLKVRNLPVGMVAAFDRDVVTLAPGESATAILNIDPNGALDDTYVFYVDAVDEDAAAPNHLRADDYGRLVVDSLGAEPSPPTALWGGFTTSKGKEYLNLGWAGPAGDVALYHVVVQEGAVYRHWRSSSINTIGARWTEGLGSFTFRVVAEGPSGKVSAPSEPITLALLKGKKR